jgi:hypothetical protein
MLDTTVFPAMVVVVDSDPMFTPALFSPNTRVPDASILDTTVLPCIIVVVNGEPISTPELLGPKRSV